tara:strand:+ start:1932 stop:2102 length:171 start_codon:yes stop_codon:yes gene_type:complete
MNFEFDKFVKDIEKRQEKERELKRESQQIVDHDEARRLRDRMYHERWQNRIVWENK